MPSMTKTLTLTLSDNVAAALFARAGSAGVEAYIEQLLGNGLEQQDIALGYQMMAADLQREEEALEWSNALTCDGEHEAR